MNQEKKEENPTLEESFTTDSESDSEYDEELESTDTDSDCGLDGVMCDFNTPFRLIIGEEAQAQSLDGIAYGLDESGSYFVISKDGDTIAGLLVHCLIERNIKEGILLPIVPNLKQGAHETAEQKDAK